MDSDNVCKKIYGDVLSVKIINQHLPTDTGLAFIAV